MAKMEININDETGKVQIDALYEDIDDFIASVSNLTTCLIYRGLQGLEVYPKEESNKTIRTITDMICNIVSESISIDSYKEFCEGEGEYEIYSFMEEVYENWLTLTLRTEEELISLLRREPLELSVVKNEKGNIELLLVKKGDKEVIENIKNIIIEEGDELSSSIAERLAVEAIVTLVVLGDRAFENEEDNYFRELEIDDVKTKIIEVHNIS